MPIGTGLEYRSASKSVDGQRIEGSEPRAEGCERTPTDQRPSRQPNGTRLIRRLDGRRIRFAFPMGRLSGIVPCMCNLYSLTQGQAAIRDFFRLIHDRVGNLPALAAVFPDQMAPIVRSRRTASANSSWRAGECPSLRNLAARRSPTFVTSRARIG